MFITNVSASSLSHWNFHCRSFLCKMQTIANFVRLMWYDSDVSVSGFVEFNELWRQKVFHILIEFSQFFPFFCCSRTHFDSVTSESMNIFGGNSLASELISRKRMITIAFAPHYQLPGIIQYATRKNPINITHPTNRRKKNHQAIGRTHCRRKSHCNNRCIQFKYKIH